MSDVKLHSENEAEVQQLRQELERTSQKLENVRSFIVADDDDDDSCFDNCIDDVDGGDKDDDFTLTLTLNSRLRKN
eukprot:410785-Hanusia_phi.AAC.1